MHSNKIPVIIVSALLIDEKDRIFLAKFPKWGGGWAIPGGRIEYGELILDALKREVLEETGISIIEAEFLRVSESIFDKTFLDGLRHMIFLDFICRKFEGTVKLDNRELREFRWVPIREAPKMQLTPATRDSIEFYMHKGNRIGK